MTHHGLFETGVAANVAARRTSLGERGFASRAA
jgi:hypothetical protein